MRAHWNSRYRPIGVKTLRTQDTSDPRHFGTSAEVSVRHFGTSAELSGHFGSAEVSGHFGTSAELSGHFGSAEVSERHFGTKEDTLAPRYIHWMAKRWTAITWLILV